jgi:hypothetical protein
LFPFCIPLSSSPLLLSSSFFMFNTVIFYFHFSTVTCLRCAINQ